MDDAQKQDVRRLCRDILGPLIASDGGDLLLIGIDGDEVHLHLTGACSGCPGASITRDDMITPTLRSAVAQVRVVVTTGYPVPAGAEKL